MSKTTIALFIFLFIFIGVLLYVIYYVKPSSLITSISTPIRSVITPANTTLSFSPNTQFMQPGQTVTISVIIHNTNPHPRLVQLEISYDPTILTVDYLTPGSFFTNPSVALQRIDTSTGRISYALHCPTSGTSNTTTDCANDNSSTLATITVTTSPYAFKRTTTLTFLPKTVVRTGNGRDILQSSIPLNVTIGNSLYPVSSTSAVASSGANYIRLMPAH